MADSPDCGRAGGGARGRGRDAGIDARILAAAARQLARYGYRGMSLAAVAEEAGTTRQALYRRWAGKADLAAAVVAAQGVADAAQTSATAAGTAAGPDGAAPDPFRALVAELADFERGVSRPGRMSLVGTMLQETTEPELAAEYQARVIGPRRRRLHAILTRAAVLGLIDQDADLTVALTMCTGSWYGRALAGDEVPPNWPERSAALVWRALGGRVPGGQVPEGRIPGSQAPAEQAPGAQAPDDHVPDGREP